MAYDVRLLCEVKKIQRIMMVENVKKQRLLQILHMIVYHITLQSAKDKSVQNQLNASETSAASDHPSASRKKNKLKSNIFKKFD